MKKSYISKIPWKPVIIGIIGIGVAFGSLHYQKKWLSTHQDTVLMPVVEKKIEQNTIIDNFSVEMKPVKKGAIDPLSVQSMQEILGKLAVSELVPGEQVRRDKLASPDYLLNPGEALVCVRTEKPEEVLAGQLTPGKRVNVVWLQNQNNPPQILARNAKVVSLSNENLQAVNTSTTSSVSQGIVSQVVPGQLTVPKYVLLKVKESESYDFARPLSGGFVSLVEVPAGSAMETPGTQKNLQSQDRQTQQQQTGQQFNISSGATDMVETANSTVR
ncbi:MAG: hypothetical protein A4E56_00409 [Pelotomaculum sp. PtaU1.Bin065]|nr:MAG: hypothetical protein A4E56_00409 [Pelotomaculum sp. PtaU1.Bin065]